jgi:SRSO17 transposase
MRLEAMESKPSLACTSRRKKARIPSEILFKTKPQIALEQIGEAVAAGVPQGTVLTDASYGCNSAFRIGVGALGLKYVSLPCQASRAGS